MVTSITPTPGTADYATTILADVPCLYWRLGDAAATAGATVADSSGNSHTGQYQNSGSLANQVGAVGGVDTAVLFDGVSTFARTNASSIGFVGTGPVSIEIWFKTSVAPSVVYLLDSHAGFASGVAGFDIRLTSTQIIGSVESSAASTTAAATLTYADGLWHHVVMTFARGGTDVLTLYFDGVSVATANAITAGQSVQPTTSIFGMNIAASSGGGPTYSGALDEFALYNTALSGAQVTAHFTAASGGALPAWVPDFAHALATARTINGVSFDGSANITVPAAGGTLTGATLASGLLASSLTSVGTLAALTVTAPITGSVTGASGSTTGNAATATALATPRTINSVSFDGSTNITVTAAAGTLTGATLASGVTSSTLTTFTTTNPLTAVSPLVITQLALALVDTDGLALVNTTAATVGVPVQIPASIRFHGRVWNTTSAASNTDEWLVESIPVSGLVPSGRLSFRNNANGAGLVTAMVIDGTGNLTASGSLTLPATGSIVFTSRGFLAAGASDGLFAFRASSLTGVGFNLVTDAVLKVRTIAQTGYASIVSGATGIAVTTTDGHLLENETAATSGVPVQFSPRLRFRSSVWNTTTPLTNTTDFWIETQPTSGATPSVSLRFTSSLNGATAVLGLTLTSSGTVTAAGSINSGNALTAASGGLMRWLTKTIATSPNDAQVTWTNNAVNAGIGFDISTDGVLKIRTRAQAADATVAALVYQTMTAVIAAGGGAAPTFTTIGGSGPATAGMNGWMKFLDSTGASVFVPVWK